MRRLNPSHIREFNKLQIILHQSPELLTNVQNILATELTEKEREDGLTTLSDLVDETIDNIIRQADQTKLRWGWSLPDNYEGIPEILEKQFEQRKAHIESARDEIMREEWPTEITPTSPHDYYSEATSWSEDDTLSLRTLVAIAILNARFSLPGYVDPRQVGFGFLASMKKETRIEKINQIPNTRYRLNIEGSTGIDFYDQVVFIGLQKGREREGIKNQLDTIWREKNLQEKFEEQVRKIVSGESGGEVRDIEIIEALTDALKEKYSIKMDNIREGIKQGVEHDFNELMKLLVNKGWLTKEGATLFNKQMEKAFENPFEIKRKRDTSRIGHVHLFSSYVPELEKLSSKIKAQVASAKQFISTDLKFNRMLLDKIAQRVSDYANFFKVLPYEEDQFMLEGNPFVDTWASIVEYAEKKWDMLETYREMELGERGELEVRKEMQPWQRAKALLNEYQATRNLEDIIAMARALIPNIRQKYAVDVVKELATNKEITATFVNKMIDEVAISYLTNSAVRDWWKLIGYPIQGDKNYSDKIKTLRKIVYDTSTIDTYKESIAKEKLSELIDDMRGLDWQSKDPERQAEDFVDATTNILQLVDEASDPKKHFYIKDKRQVAAMDDSEIYHYANNLIRYRGYTDGGGEEIKKQEAFDILNFDTLTQLRDFYWELSQAGKISDDLYGKVWSFIDKSLGYYSDNLTFKAPYGVDVNLKGIEGIVAKRKKKGQNEVLWILSREEAKGKDRKTRYQELYSTVKEVALPLEQGEEDITEKEIQEIETAMQSNHFEPVRGKKITPANPKKLSENQKRMLERFAGKRFDSVHFPLIYDKEMAYSNSTDRKALLSLVKAGILRLIRVRGNITDFEPDKDYPGKYKSGFHYQLRQAINIEVD